MVMTSDVFNIAVLGGGSFGTAIAKFTAENGYPVRWWMRNQKQAELCQQSRCNARYFPEYQFSDNIEVCADLAVTLRSARLVFVCIPSSSLRNVVQDMRPFLPDDAMIISTAKGIEPKSFTLMGDVLAEELPNHVVGALSGPNFAKEIVAGHYTATVIASDSDQLIECVQRSLSSSTFRVYANHDRFGVELGGALKNIYAIITGMAAALGTGQNTQAMLLTRSLAEMSRFARVLGANPMTFLGLAGVGDLILTCSSSMSRNYQVGFAVGEGKSLDEAIEQVGQVAEGVATVSTVKAKADELGVYMPLVQGLYSILFGGKSVAEVTHQLMTAAQNRDVECFSET